MEPDNSQFSEVPSEEAAAAATPKAKKPRKSRAVKAPVDIGEATPLRSDLEGPEGFEVGNWAKALVRKGAKNPEDKAVLEAAKLEKYYHANKRRYGVQSGSKAVEDDGKLPKASPETEHKIGSHGPLTGGPASLEDLMSLSRVDAAKLHENSDECSTCAENHQKYTTDVLPVLHANGEHNDTKGTKVLGDNMHPQCEGCQEKIGSLAFEHKKGKHTKFGLGARIGFAKNGCVECETAHDSKLAEEHTAGEHAGGETNRRPSCKACQEVQAKEDEAISVNADIKGLIAGARIKRRSDLRGAAVTNEIPQLSTEAVTTGVATEGGLLHTRLPEAPNRKAKQVYERIPTNIDDPTILPERNAYLKGQQTKKAKSEAAEQDMWNDYLPGRPNYKGFALPSVGAKSPTETRAGRTVGASEEELSDYHGDATVSGTREYIPQDLRPGFKAPEVIPSKAAKRNTQLSNVASAVSDFQNTHDAYMADRSDMYHAETMLGKHKDIHTAITSAGLSTVFDSFKSNPGVLHHLAEHPLLTQQSGGKVKELLSAHFVSTGDEEGLDRLYGTHALPYKKQGGYNARIKPYRPSGPVAYVPAHLTTTDLGLTPTQHVENSQPKATSETGAEQKMWDDYMTTDGTTMPTNLGYPTKGTLNCQNCGKMISPVSGTINPTTGTVPKATCRGCQREDVLAQRDAKKAKDV